MAAPLLISERLQVTVGAPDVSGTAVPAGRAQVGRIVATCLTGAGKTAATDFGIRLVPGVGSPHYVCKRAVALGETVEIPGVVLIEGDTLLVSSVFGGADGQVDVAFFAEESDY